jgi:hypothetical protein
MLPISEFNPITMTGRMLIFCPAYPEGHEMRMRIVDASFVKFTDGVTHFVPLVELELQPEETIYQRNGYADRDEYLTYLSEEFDIDLDIVETMADILGPNEDFDGLYTALEDGEGR